MMGDDPEGIISSLGKGRTFKQVNRQVIELINAKMKEKSVSKIKRAISLSGYGEKNKDVAQELMEKVKALPCDDFVMGNPDLWMRFIVVREHMVYLFFYKNRT